jgi:hypothetical protein
VPQLAERGWVNPDQRTTLGRVDQLLTAMSAGDAPDRGRLWTLDGLQADARWAHARVLATQALEALMHPARHDSTKRKPTSGTEH